MEIKNLITKNTSSHYYFPDGRSCFEVDSADGKKKVKTNITHARKLGLLPSVTTVFKLLNKEGVTVWRLEQMFKAAKLIKQIEGEDDYDYYSRVVEESERISTEAKSFGDKIHKYCEFALTANPDVLECDIPQKTKDAIKVFINEHITNARAEVLSMNKEMGYAGRVDCICDFDGAPCITDFKSQRTTTDKGDVRDVAYYKEMIYQGAAYCMAEGMDRFISVVISSTEPGRIEYKIWDKKEFIEACEIFFLLLKLFKKINKLER